MRKGRVCDDESVNHLFQDPLLDAAREAAVIASHRMVAWADALSATSIGSKDGRNDLVTAADAEIEALVLHRLLLRRPQDTVVGEEGAAARSLSDHPDGAALEDILSRSAATADAPAAAAAVPELEGTFEWHVDPIDGTVNFVRGIEHFCFSVGVREQAADAASPDDGWVAGLVAAPLLDRVWFARSGSAWSASLAALTDPHTPLRELTGESAATTGRVVATGFGYAQGRRDQQLVALASVMEQFDDIRRCGSAAIDLCMAAEGRVNAYYERGLGVYDFAGGAYIAECAGRFVHRRADAFLRDDTGATIAVTEDSPAATPSPAAASSSAAAASPAAVPSPTAAASPAPELTVVADTRERFEFLLAHG